MIDTTFVYSRRDVIIVGVAAAMIVALLGVGFGMANAKTINIVETNNIKEHNVPKSNFELALDILDKYPVIDGHNDFPLAVRDVFQNDLRRFDFDSDLTRKGQPLEDYEENHTDLPRLRKGKVGGQFWSAYLSCSSQFKDAVQLFMEQVDVIKRLAKAYPDDLMFVTTSDGITQAFAQNKLASLIGVESGHAIGSNLGIVRSLYELGARYMTLTHTCNTPWADSSEAESSIKPRSSGLSDFGETVVKEMNRLGMMVDLSHVSNETMADVLAVTRSPVIFSHSSARAINDHPRNVPDNILEKVKTNGGIVMANFYSCFLIPDCNTRNATIQDLIKHINHIRDVAGVDHVGLGGDYNGVESFPLGLEDVSGYPKIFEALIEDGWAEEDLGKLASGNIRRVLYENEEISQALAYEEPYQTWIDPEAFTEEEMEYMSE